MYQFTASRCLTASLKLASIDDWQIHDFLSYCGCFFMIIKDFNNFKLNAKKNCTKRIGQNQAEENV